MDNLSLTQLTNENITKLNLKTPKVVTVSMVFFLYAFQIRNKKNHWKKEERFKFDQPATFWIKVGSTEGQRSNSQKCCLKGHCPLCSKAIRLQYTQIHLEMENDGTKNLSEVC